MTPVMAFVFLATFGPIPGGGSYIIVIPGIYDENDAIRLLSR